MANYDIFHGRHHAAPVPEDCPGKCPDLSALRQVDESILPHDLRTLLVVSWAIYRRNAKGCQQQDKSLPYTPCQQHCQDVKDLYPMRGAANMNPIASELQ